MCNVLNEMFYANCDNPETQQKNKSQVKLTARSKKPKAKRQVRMQMEILENCPSLKNKKT